MMILLQVEFGRESYPKVVELYSHFDRILQKMEHFRVAQFSFLLELSAVQMTMLENFCRKASLPFFALELMGQIRSTWIARPDVSEWLRGKGVPVGPIEF